MAQAFAAYAVDGINIRPAAIARPAGHFQLKGRFMTFSLPAWGGCKSASITRCGKGRNSGSRSVLDFRSDRDSRASEGAFDLRWTQTGRVVFHEQLVKRRGEFQSVDAVDGVRGGEMVERGIVERLLQAEARLHLGHEIKIAFEAVRTNLRAHVPPETGNESLGIAFDQTGGGQERASICKGHVNIVPDGISLLHSNGDLEPSNLLGRQFTDA